jgi:hypothetical protein
MRIEWHHWDSSVVSGDKIDRLPILDWKGFYINPLYVYKQGGFTGEYHNVLFWAIVLFRHQFGLRLEFNRGKISPDEAKQQYHTRRIKK